ncbi:MAG: hypothetical protein ACREQY_13145, partial [Candidatus Binatia bacterium]
AGRAEDFRDERLDAVVARGIEERVLAGLATGLLRAGGRLIAMRTARQGQGSWPGFEVTERRAYVLPGAFRHEVLLLRRRFT